MDTEPKRGQLKADSPYHSNEAHRFYAHAFADSLEPAISGLPERKQTKRSWVATPSDSIECGLWVIKDHREAGAPSPTRLRKILPTSET